MKPIDLSLILPLYNESAVLSRSLFSLEEILKNTGLNFELILIDDKSADNTASLARDFKKNRDNVFLFEHQENIGRGGTVSEGLKKARGKVAGFIDVDLENSPEKMPEAARIILSGEADIVTGRRIYRFQPRSIVRYFASKGYHLLMKYFLFLPLKDTETGFKFFNREKIRPLLEKAKDKRWFWDTEIMALSHYYHLKIREIPVIFKRRPEKKSTVRVFRDSADYLVKLIRFKFRGKNEKSL